MTTARSDAPAVFGATGDLAHKTIFPALCAMVKRGALTVPVIGVAFPKSSLERLLGRIVVWVEHHPVLAVFLPAVLPPPIPLSPFVLASGALGVSRGQFFTVFGAARILRYSLIAWLGLVYGRHVVRLWAGTLQKWSTPLLWIFVALLIGGVCVGIRKARSLRKSDAAEELALRDEATQAD
jgi:membrane protein YqaA with SNARE-associated domain